MFCDMVNEKGVPGYITTDKITYKSLKYFTKKNRKNQTKAEAILWNELRNRKLGFKFRRQHAIEKYIGDFVCLEKKLVIEIDGEYHMSIDRIEYDKLRTEVLNIAGYQELRFMNQALIYNLEEVLSVIKSFL